MIYLLFPLPKKQAQTIKWNMKLQKFGPNMAQLFQDQNGRRTANLLSSMLWSLADLTRSHLPGDKYKWCGHFDGETQENMIKTIIRYHLNPFDL